MVAPYDIGDPARSFIRIPGSGSDPSLKSVCCDLSRGSAAAAASPIPQNIPHMSLTPATKPKIVQSKVKCDVKPHEANGNQKPSSQHPSAERQQGAQSYQLTKRKIPLKMEEKDFKILKHNKTEHQIMIPCKVIKVNTGKIAVQSTPPQRMNFNITTIKTRTVNQPTTISIKKPIKRMSPSKSFNINGAALNSQHSRGIPEEKKGKLLKHPNHIKDQLFQEIFKDKKRLAALLKRMNVIR